MRHGMFGRHVSVVLLLAYGFTAAPAESPQLTRENFDRVTAGMTKVQVIEILGKNRSSVSSGGDVTLGWHFPNDAGHRAEVHFKDGVVVSKHSSIDWAKHGDATAKPAAATKPVEVEAKPPDPLAKYLAALRSTDAKRAANAMHALAGKERDDDAAPEVSRLAERWYAKGDLGAKMEARACLKVWCTRENSAYFIGVLERHGRTDGRKAGGAVDVDFALDILTRLRDPAAVPAIARLLGRFFDRDGAAKALVALGPELAQAEVLKYANHKDADVAAAARKVLASFKTPPAELLARNLADLKSPVSDKRLWAAQAIERLDVVAARRAEVAAALEPLLADRYAWPAHAAAAALVKWGTAANEPSLVKALSHASPDMRRLAAEALKSCGTAKALPALEALAAKPDAVHPEVAKAAREAIAGIRGRG
jgi:hypothetical protein